MESAFGSITAFSEMTSVCFWRTDESGFVIESSGPLVPEGTPLFRTGPETGEISVEAEDEEKLIERLLNQAPIRNLRVSLTFANEPSRFLSLFAEPLTDDKDGFSGYRGVATDISTSDIAAPADSNDPEYAYRDGQSIRVSTAYRVARMGSFVWSKEGDRLKWGPDLVQLIGLDPARDGLAAVRKAFDAKSYAGYARERDKALSTGEPFTVLLAINSPLLGRVQMRVYGEPQKDETGEYRSVVGIIQDVTQTEGLSFSLEQSQEQMERAERVSQFGSWVYDLSDRLVHLSPGAAKIFELPENQGLKLSQLTSLFQKEDLDAYFGHRDEMIQSGRAISHECSITLPSGVERRLRLSARARYDEIGLPSSVLIIVQNITDEYEATQALQAARQSLEKAEITGKFGHWFGNQETRTIRLSKGASLILGLPADESVDLETWRAGLPPEDWKRYNEQRDRFLATGEIIEGDFNWQLGDAPMKRVRIRIEPDYDKVTGKLSGFGIIKDITEEYRAQQALEESQRNLREAHLIARTGFFKTDLVNETTVWSAEAIEILGLDSSTASEKEIVSLLNREDTAEYIEKRTHADQTGEAVTGRMRFHYGPEREERWLSYRMIVHKDEAGKLIGRTSVIQDITDQVRLEQEQERTDTVLKHVIEHAHTGVSVRDLEGRFVLSNFMHRKQMNAEHIDFINKRVVDIQKEAGLSHRNQSVAASDQQVIETGEVLEYEDRWADKDGIMRDYRHTKYPIRDQEGNVIGVGTIRADVTEFREIQRRLEASNAELEQKVLERTEELKRSEERYRSYATSSNDWFFETDADRKVLWVSSSIDGGPRSSSNPAIGMRIDDLRPDEEVVGREEIEKWDRLLELWSQKEPIRDQEVWWKFQGEHQYCRVNIKPVISDGQITAYHAAATDITQLQAARRQLGEAEKMASLGRLVAGIAHELNTPIGSARTLASLIGEQTAKIDQAIKDGTLRRSSLNDFIKMTHDSIEIVNRSLERSAELIARFKEVSADQSSGLRRTFQLLEVVENNVAAVIPSFKHMPVEVSVEIPTGIEMDSNPGALGQVITNLVHNAFVHAFEPGKPGNLRIAGHEIGGGAVAITVSDDGQGMTDETMRRVFDPFYTTRLGSGGTGLGMNISYNLVTGLLGGRIAVRRSNSGGTEFSVTLPLTAPVENEATPDVA